MVDVHHIILTCNVEPLTFTVEEAIPCGLIIQELVSNAFKHAFPEGQQGNIRISLRQEAQKCILIVENSGIPFPAEIDFHQADTMGLDLVNTFTKQLQGTITLERNEGTIFIITFLKN